VPTVARVSKRNDTWEPVSGRIFDANGPFDLTGATLRFLAKANVGGVDTIIDSDSVSPAHGVCVNVEDEEGAGTAENVEWPVGSGTMIATTTNRGRWRFEPTTVAVSVAAPLYEMEIEASKGGKTLTFPNKESENPGWQIDPDIA